MQAGKSNTTLFATTRWTLVCDAARGGGSGAVEALGALFATALLDKVLDGLALEEAESDFARWKPFLTVSSARLSFADIAAEFGMTEGAARVAVHRLRKRYRQRLRDEIGRTLADPHLVEDEMRSLFAALSQ